MSHKSDELKKNVKRGEGGSANRVPMERSRHCKFGKTCHQKLIQLHIIIPQVLCLFVLPELH